MGSNLNYPTQVLLKVKSVMGLTFLFKVYNLSHKKFNDMYSNQVGGNCSVNI